MASQIDIVNWAIIKQGGETRLTSLDDNKKAAIIMKPLWDLVRQSELRKHFWNFSIGRTTLAADGTPPTFGFGNYFPLPADFLRVIQIGDYYATPSLTDYVNDDNSAYAIEGKKIATDFGAPLNFRYVKNITDPGQFDPLFAELMASKLAYEGCESMTQSNTKKSSLAEDYKNTLRQAVLVNAIERPPVSISDDSWMLGRL